MKDYLGYKDKVCVVTGAASGMGKACAEALVDLGAKVYALDVAEVTTPGIEAFYHCNMGSRESIDEVFGKLPRQIDKVFAWAGISGERHPAKTVLLINYVGNKYLLEEVLPERMTPETGAIMVCTSIGGNRWYSEVNRPEQEPLVNCKGWEEAEKILDVICEDLPSGQAYTFGKRALTYYSMKMVAPYAKKHVRINVLKPGSAKTGLFPEFVERFLRLHPGSTIDDYNAAMGLVRGVAECSECAEPAIFLNSDMASYVTGVELLVDYGQDAAIMSGNNQADMWTGEKLVHKYEA